MAELPTRIRLTVVSRERKLIEQEVDEVVVPGSDGEIGVLPGHTPLLTTLRVGPMRYRVGSTYYQIVLTWGFAEVLPDRVIVLAEGAKLPSEIDITKAEANRLEAEKELAYLSSNDPEFAAVEGKLEEAIAMINVHHGH